MYYESSICHVTPTVYRVETLFPYQVLSYLPQDDTIAVRIFAAQGKRLQWQSQNHVNLRREYKEHDGRQHHSARHPRRSRL